MVRGLSRVVTDTVVRWRSGSRRGQLTVLGFITVINLLFFAVAFFDYERLPVSGFYVPLLLGMILLRFWPLMSHIAITVVLGAIAVVHEGPLTTSRTTSILLMTVSIAVIVFQASRQRSGLPGPLGQAMLVDLRDRLQSQGVVPPLPAGWRSQSATETADGIKFAGDFLVADLSSDEKYLEMVLVDVCGKGVGAGSQSLQFAGALGGLIGSLPAQGLFAAANHFLLRQQWDEGFATAVHVGVDLVTGQYWIINAGHPPAMRWSSRSGEWEVDGARGIALGITERPDFEMTSGELEIGDALLFYTDGVIESRTQGVTDGIAWLRETARQAVSSGFDNAPRRILARVENRDDDRAVLMLLREG